MAQIEKSELPLEDALSAFIGPVLRHWRDISSGKPVANYKDFRPEEIGAALSHVALIELKPNESGQNLFLRLVGDEVKNATLGLVKGAYIENVQPDWYRDFTVNCYRDAFEHAEPQFQDIQTLYQGQKFSYRRLLLPMTSDGETVDLMLAATQRSEELRNYMSAQERTFK